MIGDLRAFPHIAPAEPNTRRKQSPYRSIAAAPDDQRKGVPYASSIHSLVSYSLAFYSRHQQPGVSQTNKGQRHELT
jgi:hypothetical protein